MAGNTKTANNSTVVGVFNTRGDAEQAVERLLEQGYSRDEIGVIGRNAEGKVVSQKADEGNAGEGAAIGAATGAGVAGLVSLGISYGMIPAIGPILAIGPLAAALLSAVGGAAAASLAGALIGWGVPEEDAQFYESQVEAGKFLVTVKAKHHDEAWKLMKQGGAYNRETADARTMKLHEERLRAHKESVQTGEVTLRKETTVEHKTIEVPVKKEEVIVERRAVGGAVASAADLKDGEVIRVPVSEERVHVEKTPVVTEEVSLKKRVVEETEKVDADVRKENVKVVPKGDVKVDHTTKGANRR